MRKHKSSLLLPLVAVLSLSLFGCSNQVLDHRNAEFNNGVIYAGNANEPFTGTVTNVPDIELLQNQNGFTAFGNVLVRIAFPGSNWSARALTTVSITGYCEVSVRKGILDGKTVCKAPGTDNDGTVMHFKGGLLDGTMKYYNSTLARGEMAEATFENGVLTGKETIYNPRTRDHDKIAVLHWANGALEGEFQYWDLKGNLTDEGSYMDGKKVVTEVDKFKEELSKPVTITAVKTTAPAPVAPTMSLDDCVGAWTAAYRKERSDPDVIVNIDQIDEWKQWCQQGKQAPTTEI